MICTWMLCLFNNHQQWARKVEPHFKARCKIYQFNH